MRQQKIFTDMPSKTQQNFKKDCDINLIYSRFQQTGQLPEGRIPQPQYGQQVNDFQDVAFATARARSTFEALPQKTRERYGSLEGVIEAMQDPASASQLHADGILTAYGIPTPPEMENPSREEHTPSPANTERSDEGEALSEASK